MIDMLQVGKIKYTSKDEIIADMMVKAGEAGLSNEVRRTFDKFLVGQLTPPRTLVGWYKLAADALFEWDLH